ncbi:DNA-binding domain-containing protein [Clostridiaceae bacterium 35-E11]
MRFYIVDDDINIVLVLKNIIEKQNLGTVVGYEHNGQCAYEEIIQQRPDIILIDYLMPEIDGATLVRLLKDHNLDTHYIMISQVSEPEMVSDVYIAGIEFFIHKPINVVEVERVIKSVSEKIMLTRKFDTLRGLIMDNSLEIQKKYQIKDTANTQIQRIRKILNEIAILGERGTTDIIAICEYKINEKERAQDLSLNELCKMMGKKPKIMKQRMRRTSAVGLRNLAHIGIEDNLNEYFLKYANTLYDFEDIRFEMEMLRGKRKSGGRINLEKFIENLIMQSQDI